MISGWVLGLVILFILLFGVVIVFLMRINTNMEILVRAIPFGAPKILERRPPPQAEERGTRPVGGSTSTGRH